MKQIALIPAVVALFIGSEGHAQTNEPDAMDRLLNLFEDFTNDSSGFMENLLTEMGPALNQLQDTIEDWSNYEPPEVLPNGDIIIRRKPDTTRHAPQLPEGTKEI